MFQQTFDEHACVGDLIWCEVDGITYYAVLHHDPDTTPEDFDCYTDREITRWKNDDWFFGTVEIVAEVDGWTKKGLAFLGGVDVNLASDNRYLTDIANDILPDAMGEVTKTRMVTA